MNVDILLHIFKHLNDLDIGAAVTRAFERTERRGNRCVSIRAGGGNDVGGKGGVVTAAVFRVKHESEVENLCFQLGEFTVFTEKMEKIFRCGKLGLGDMDEKALVFVIMLEGLIAVNGEHREYGDELQALTENVSDGGIVGIFIVSVERKDASGEDIHHIFAGSFEDHIADERSRQAAVFGKGATEAFELLGIGKLGEKKKVGCFFKTETIVIQETFHEVAHVDAAVS